MADKKPETKEAREARWWADWWAADYSWDRLAKKAIEGGGQWGERTLQDYWRRDPNTGKRRTAEALKATGELVAFDGRWWHVAHLPPRSENGEESSWKADAPEVFRESLSRIVAARLASANQTVGEEELGQFGGAWPFVPAASDRRARLDGVVLFGLPVPQPPDGESAAIHLCCAQAMFLTELDCKGANFGPDTRFESATFSGGARFDGATFSEDASFNGANFSGYGGFNSATFSGDARFDSSTFSEGSDFKGAIFSGYSGFYNVTFSEEAAFSNATFSGSARFDSATFFGEASFNSATFSRDVSFKSFTIFGYVDFSSATFSEGAGFGSATFSEDAFFNRAIFSGEASFNSVTFSGYSSFDSAAFSREARFDGVTFSEEAKFDRARFAKPVSFASDPASEGPKRALFERAGLFRNAVFEGPVTFAAQVDHPESGFAGAFYGARFADIADFSRSGPVRPGVPDRNDGARMAVAFAEALFEKTLILTDDSDADAAKAFRCGAMGAVRAMPAGPDREALLDRLEAGCRTVKIAMGKARDEAREQRYYRFQLQAHQARRDTHWPEKVFGWLYGLVSNYGGSLDRPLGCWALLAFVCGLAYWLAAAGLDLFNTGDMASLRSRQTGLGVHDLFDALSYSASRGLLTNIWMGPSDDPQGWSAIFLNGHGGVFGFFVRLVSALQSILSGILLFLFALAVRRRFQIGG